MSQTYGYARVSSIDQHEDRQIAALVSEGVDMSHIFVDKISGKDFDRPMYRELVSRLKKGDLLCIKSIDRLGRNYEDILSQWKLLTKDRMVDISVIDMPLLNTRSPIEGLVGTFISDLVLQILSFVAENERINIRQRQAEGIAIARERGVRFGRPEKENPPMFAHYCLRWETGEITASSAASELGMPVSTFKYKAKKYTGHCDKATK